LRALHNNTDPDTLARLRETYSREYSIVAIKDAYLHLAEYAYFRPEAPMDSRGGIPFEIDLNDPIRLEIEAWCAGLRFSKQQDDQLFTINGHPDYVTTTAMFYALQAAQLCGARADRKARRALELALKALPPEPKVTFDN
jgi:hypothetical protein